MLPEGVELIDFFHAAQHLSDAFDAAYGANAPKAVAQFEKYRHLLRYDDDGVAQVIRALRHLRSKHPECERIAQVLGYFRNNRHRMGYAEAKDQGLPIGSGVVEATCKTLVTERLKRSGMRWSERGGQAILTLRALLQSHRFESGWSLLLQTYRADVSAPQCCAPAPTKNPLKMISFGGNPIEYHRFLSYSHRGSEFICLASRSQGNKYERGGKEGVDKVSARGGDRKDWRRKPYTPSQGAKSKSNCGYDKLLKVAESSWCEESDTGTEISMVGSVVFGREPPKGKSPLHHSIVEIEGTVDDVSDSGRQVVRPWHVRVSEYFVLLDFCRNEKMFERGMVTVPPLTFRTANTVIKVARMFGEVLDPVKKHLGNISVVRGMEPKGFAEAEDARMQCHRWVPAFCDTHSVEFVTPTDPSSGYLDLLERDRRVVDIEAGYDYDFGGDRVRVTIRGFDPRRHFTSADGKEYPWTE